MKLPHHRLAVALLSMPAWLYGCAIRMRNRHYDRPGRGRRAGLPVLSVGNLTAGGTGKTPFVAWLAEQLLSEGLRPAVVSRGYGGRAGKGPMVVSEGRGATCGATECGDEPYLLASKLPGVPVVVGSNRYEGAEAARRQGADVVILDDGFQHRSLARDLDILLLEAANPFGNHRLLPAGPLREPLSSLERADVIVITRSLPDDRFPDIERTVRRYNSSAPMLRSGHRVAGFVDQRGRPTACPARAVVFCGIGNPDRFRSDILSAGTEIASFKPYEDHHRYSAADMRALRKLALACGAALATTEKDIARLGSSKIWPDHPALTALRIEVELYDADPLLRAIRLAVAKHSQ